MALQLYSGAAQLNPWNIGALSAFEEDSCLINPYALLSYYQNGFMDGQQLSYAQMIQLLQMQSLYGARPRGRRHLHRVLNGGGWGGVNAWMGTGGGLGMGGMGGMGMGMSGMGGMGMGGMGMGVPGLMMGSPFGFQAPGW